ncbi:MAG TPA: lipase family protein [Xanthobacteraceae bacterium]|nr:lipase family protein [Xanthobacteraceae bacterium]
MNGIGDIEPDDVKNIPTFRAAYSDRTALLMARFAFRAYTAFDVDDDAVAAFEREFSELGLTNCVGLIDRDLGTAGLAVAGEDIIVIAFRGTQDDLDWRTNVNAAWVVLQGGVRVHTGFFQAYWPIRDTLFETVQRFLSQKARPVYIAGHSLGGALATMATAELANHADAMVRDAIAACYTFGAPRVGDSSFDQFVSVPLYRVTNGIDIVPVLPPFFLGYRTTGDTRYFGRSGTAPLRKSPALIWQLWPTILGLVKWATSGKLQSIEDHLMSVYLGKLAAWAMVTLEATKHRRDKTVDPTIGTREGADR